MMSEINFHKNLIEIIYVIPKIYKSAVKEDLRTRFVFDEGKGIYEAMQLGVENARGKFLIFINDDDSLVSNFSDILINSRIGVASKIDLYEFNVANLYKNMVKVSRFMPDTKLNFGQMPTSHQGQLWSTETLRKLEFFRKDVLLSTVFRLRIKLRIAADLDLYIRAKELGIKKVQMSRVVAIVKPGGYSDRNSQRRYLEVAAVIAARRKYSIFVWAFMFLRFQISGLISRFKKYD
jgi:glycosyltransferase involved in cell wall biosynthesis